MANSLSMRLHYSLYADGDSSFFLKMEGEDIVHRFPDFLAALNFIHRVRGGRGVCMTVYDSLGQVALNNMIIESEDCLLFA